MRTHRAIRRTGTAARPGVSVGAMPALDSPGRVAVRQILHAPRPQAKLTVGAPDDAFEQEADRVADQVMRMPEPGVAAAAAPPRVQRMCAECEEEKEKQG